MTQPFRHTRRVEFRDTDAAGIVHFSVFFNYMEEAEHSLLRHLGVNVVMTDADGEYSFPRVAARCEFEAPLRFGDEVAMDVTVARLGSSSVTYHFEFSRAGQRIAFGEVTVVCCRLSKTSAPSPMPVPPDFAQKLATLVA